MRDNLPFDDFVQQQLSGYSPNVPGHIWENIAAAKRKSKPRGFWMNLFNRTNILIVSVIVLIGAGGASYLLLTSNDNSLDKNIIAGENVPASEGVNTATGKSNEENNSANLTNKSTQEDKNINDVVPEQTINSDNSPTQNNFFTPLARKQKTKYTDAIEVSSPKINNEEIIAVSQDNKEVSNTIVFSSFRFNNAREVTGTKSINSLNIKLPDCPAIEKNAAGNKKYWEVYAGPDYAFNSYKSYGDTASANYLQKRKASTKFASAFSAGIRYTKVFNNGTSVRAGLNYTQVNEKFTYFNPNEIKYITVITTRVVIRAPGDTVYINDTLQYQQTGTRTKTTYNRYRNIDIPLVIGYELGNGKIHANINAGVIINIYSWYKGDVLDSLYQPVSITTGKGNSIYQFKNNIGVGFIGSISLYYKMTDKLRLVLEPYFRYNLSPMSNQNLNLQQKYNIAGLRAGVRFDLK